MSRYSCMVLLPKSGYLSLINHPNDQVKEAAISAVNIRQFNNLKLSDVEKINLKAIGDTDKVTLNRKSKPNLTSLTPPDNRNENIQIEPLTRDIGTQFTTDRHVSQTKDIGIQHVPQTKDMSTQYIMPETRNVGTQSQIIPEAKNVSTQEMNTQTIPQLRPEAKNIDTQTINFNDSFLENEDNSATQSTSMQTDTDKDYYTQNNEAGNDGQTSSCKIKNKCSPMSWKPLSSKNIKKVMKDLKENDTEMNDNLEEAVPLPRTSIASTSNAVQPLFKKANLNPKDKGKKLGTLIKGKDKNKHLLIKNDDNLNKEIFTAEEYAKRQLNNAPTKIQSNDRKGMKMKTASWIRMSPYDSRKKNTIHNKNYVSPNIELNNLQNKTSLERRIVPVSLGGSNIEEIRDIEKEGNKRKRKLTFSKSIINPSLSEKNEGGLRKKIKPKPITPKRTNKIVMKNDQKDVLRGVKRPIVNRNKRKIVDEDEIINPIRNERKKGVPRKRGKKLTMW